MYKILLTNARSLSPKIESLHNMFSEHQIDIALITESWLSDGTVLDRDIVDLELGTGLKIIYKNRPKTRAGARKVGGGVSIIYNKDRCSMRERKIVGNKFELVLAVGRIGKIRRQFAFFCAYIVPNMKVADHRELNELVKYEILQLRSKGDPLIFLGGDLNHKNLDESVDAYADIKRLNFDPTRGPSCLDVMYANTDAASTVWPPLETQTGTQSDHSCVLFVGEEAKQKDFVWTKKTVRKFTDKAANEYGRFLADTNWEQVFGNRDSPDELVAAFEKHTLDEIDRLFPLQTIRCRSNEPPWMTNNIRRLSRLKRRVFRREGKSNLWCRLRDKVLQLLASSKSAYVDRAMQSGSTGRSYFNAVKSLSTHSTPREWDLMDLFEGQSPTEAGDQAATFFTQISDQFEPLAASSVAPDHKRSPITVAETAKFLKLAKKPNSAVKGDLMPSLVKRHHHLLAAPVTRIFNAVFSTGQWPAAWKVETTVVIPKTTNPASLSECRNISCTAFLSKVLETVLLEDLRKETVTDPVQYGGIKGSSADHLLVDLYDQVLSGLDQGCPSAVLGIDYQKAFNRLNHRECLAKLRDLGASSASLSLVRSFLADRTMRVKVGQELSQPRKLKGGSPQGSILGCFLYCATTQHIVQRQQPPGATPTATPLNAGLTSPDRTDEEEADPGLGVMTWAGGVSPVSPVARPPSPTTAAWPEALPANNVDLDGPVAATKRYKYVDDTTVVDTIPRGKEIRHVSSNTPTEWIPATSLEVSMNTMIEESESIGMLINCGKTQLLCISVDNGYAATTSIVAKGETISSQDSMKLLGFMLGTSGMSAQVDHIKRKFRHRFWSLIHLRRSGITGGHLYRLYTVFVRPVIETNSVVYHPMITKTQSEEIERLQKLVFRLCFGPTASYRRETEQGRIKTLKARRETAVRRFTEKAMQNPRYSDRWFVRRPDVDTSLRTRRPFIEKRCRTERMMKNPLVHIQRTANDILTA